MSTNSKHNAAVAAITAETRKKEPVVSIIGFALAGNGMARIVADVTHTSESRNDHSLALKAITNKFENKMAAIADTFRSVSKSNFVEQVTGIVGVVRQVVPVTEDMKGFRATASNMFMDDEKDMWILHKTESGEILVKNTGIDDELTLTKLLESKCSAVYGAKHNEMRAICSAIASSVEGGDFVSYVDINNNLRTGYVAATTDEGTAVVLSSDLQEYEVVPLNAVVDVHDTSDFPATTPSKEEEVDLIATSARGGVDINFLLSYYKRIYNSNPAFYQAFSQRIKRHAFA